MLDAHGNTGPLADATTEIRSSIFWQQHALHKVNADNSNNWQSIQAISAATQGLISISSS
jgi:hypothetical protein